MLMAIEMYLFRFFPLVSRAALHPSNARRPATNGGPRSTVLSNKQQPHLVRSQLTLQGACQSVCKPLHRVLEQGTARLERMSISSIFQLAAGEVNAEQSKHGSPQRGTHCT